jgi:molybdenum cofactor cytidylyltransferase
VANQALGVILAGGRGERFGGPKAMALLPDGRTFLEACAAILAQAGVVSVVATLPPRAPVSVPTGVRAVVLPEEGLAMLDSLRIALALGLQEPGWNVAVIQPVDHPLVLPRTVQALVAALPTGGAAAALPGYRGKHGHPVAVTRDVCTGIESRRHPGPTLREVIHAVPCLDVPVEDAGIVANCNTPERLAEAWRAVHGAG